MDKNLIAPAKNNDQIKSNEISSDLQPAFPNLEKLTLASLKEDIQKSSELKIVPIDPSELLEIVLKNAQPIDFRAIVGISDYEKPIPQKYFIVAVVEEVLRIAKANQIRLCQSNGSVYGYTGTYWIKIEPQSLQTLLKQAAEKMGVQTFEARYYQFGEKLLQQFFQSANLTIKASENDTVLINLKNGTYEIKNGFGQLRSPVAEDFLKYQLKFDFEPTATAPLFAKYLDQVLPDIEQQNVLAEYIGYLFVPSSVLKLEKILMLHGTGANGKSVFFEIIFALIGSNNISTASLANLTEDKGYSRAMLADKLVNYVSEINQKLETASFKQLVSGEPIEARLPYSHPFTMTNYAKQIVNCNELPRNVENNYAFFRRLIICGFDVTIPEHLQDKELAKKIIAYELSGIFNWVLSGLKRLMENKNFSKSEAIKNKVEMYSENNDNIKQFLNDSNFEPSDSETFSLKDLYLEYKNYCIDNGHNSTNRNTFSERIKRNGYKKDRNAAGMIFYMKKKMLY